MITFSTTIIGGMVWIALLALCIGLNIGTLERQVENDAEPGKIGFTVVIIIFCIVALILNVSGFKKQLKSPELTTDIPAQIDTTITQRGSIRDTTYTYHFNQD